MKELTWQFRMWLGWKLINLTFNVFPLSLVKINLAKFILAQPLESNSPVKEAGRRWREIVESKSMKEVIK